MSRVIARQLGTAVLLVVLCALGPVLTGCGGGADLEDPTAQREPSWPRMCIERPEVCK